MPIIHIFHHSPNTDIPRSLRRVCHDGSAAIGVPLDRIWALWHEVERATVCRPDWDDGSNQGPIVRIYCRRSHPGTKVLALMHTLRKSLSEELGCSETSVFVQVIRVDDEDILNVGR